MPLPSQSAVTNSLQAEEATVAGKKKKKKTFLVGKGGKFWEPVELPVVSADRVCVLNAGKRVSQISLDQDLALPILNLQASHSSSDMCRNIFNTCTQVSLSSRGSVAVFTLAVELIPG